MVPLPPQNFAPPNVPMPPQISPPGGIDPGAAFSAATGLPPLNFALDLSAGPSTATAGDFNVTGTTFGDFVFKGAGRTNTSVLNMALYAGAALIALRILRK